jgi:predicted nucleic acid-binding protein
MPVRIVDASAIVALLFGEAESRHVQALLTGHRLAAPTLFGYELGNVCRIKCRRQPEQSAAFLAAYERRHGLAIEEHPVDQDHVLALAAATGLTHYDASYLWLSRQLAAPLITLDKALLAAITLPPAAP